MLKTWWIVICWFNCNRFQNIWVTFLSSTTVPLGFQIVGKNFNKKNVKNGLTISTNSQSAGCGPPTCTVDLNQSISVKKHAFSLWACSTLSIRQNKISISAFRCIFFNWYWIDFETAFYKYYKMVGEKKQNQLTQAINLVLK